MRLVHTSYQELIMPPGSIVYCDPPYAGATKYKDRFNHADFWRWCKNRARHGHTVFVSEYAAPDGWSCVWEKEIVSSLTRDTGGKRGVERLFIYSGGFEW